MLDSFTVIVDLNAAIFMKLSLLGLCVYIYIYIYIYT
jgi:hypothetical protein